MRGAPKPAIEAARPPSEPTIETSVPVPAQARKPPQGPPPSAEEISVFSEVFVDEGRIERLRAELRAEFREVLRSELRGAIVDELREELRQRVRADLGEAVGELRGWQRGADARMESVERRIGELVGRVVAQSAPPPQDSRPAPRFDGPGSFGAPAPPPAFAPPPFAPPAFAPPAFVPGPPPAPARNPFLASAPPPPIAASPAPSRPYSVSSEALSRIASQPVDLADFPGALDGERRRRIAVWVVAVLAALLVGGLAAAAIASQTGRSL